MMGSLISVVLAGVQVLAASGEPEGSSSPGRPGWLLFVPEMEAFPELTAGTACRAEDVAGEAARARAALKGKLPDMQKHLTAEAVRALSRWARAQMAAYEKVPALAGVRWEAVRRDEGKKNLVLEGTVDTLPSHAVLVTRWLKVYALYDGGRDEVRRVVVTIRGERQE